MLDRRNLIQGVALGSAAVGSRVALAGSGLGPTLLTQGSGLNSSLVHNSSSIVSRGQGPRRVIFFLQNQGFDPATCVPAELKSSDSLDGVALPEPLKDLEPIKNEIHIVNGLHGRHTSPSHSAFFGALGGFRGGIGIPPGGATIDHVLSQKLPEAILPHLRIGMDALENMISRPTLATLSAAGPGQPLSMHSHPQDLYQLLFGGIASGEVRKQFQARSRVFDRIEELANGKSRNLPAGERKRYATFVEGFREINGLREKLAGVSSHLEKFAPEYDQRFTKPAFETDWHDALLDIGIAALQSGITNVLTIGSGRGEIFGSWKGLGITQAGHNLGHMQQPNNPVWIKIRQYNCQMLIRIKQALESIPEGEGTMMDHTLIVYTSNNAEKQHSSGADWPFVLLGNCGGLFRTGRYTRLKQRPINDLYATLLHAIGAPQDYFNFDKRMAGVHSSQAGPIEELLA